MTFGYECKKTTVEKITVNNTEINDPQLIADEFNNFFTEVGSKISNNIEPTVTTPENYINDNLNIRNLDLGQTGRRDRFTFVIFWKLLSKKKSQDLDGISIELLKFI